MTAGADTLLIGLGNECRRDDGVGLYVARRISELHLRGVRVVHGVSDVMSLISQWSHARRVILVDCCVARGVPGTVHCFDALRNSFPERLFSSYSTHAFRFNEALDLAKATGLLPESLTVYGIEGEQFAPGPGLSASVERAAHQVVARIAKEFEPRSRRSTERDEEHRIEK